MTFTHLIEKPNGTINLYASLGRHPDINVFCIFRYDIIMTSDFHGKQHYWTVVAVADIRNCFNMAGGLL